MKLFMPNYCREFKCTASLCRHSCCIGWEIDISDCMLKKYRTLTSFGKRVIDTVSLEGGAAHFKMLSDGRCPHLNSEGLCNLIIEHGEAALTDICREHPRFYNIVGDRCEGGLGAACEEASRLILECEDYTRLCECGEVDTEPSDTDFDMVSEREKIYSILSDKSRPYSQRLSLIGSAYGIPIEKFGNMECHSLISSLEYLNERHRELFLTYTNSALPSGASETYLERALAYFIYRHLSTSESYAELSSSLWLCLFLERLFASLLMREKSVTLGSACEILRVISEEIEYSEDNIDRIRFLYLFQ